MYPRRPTFIKRTQKAIELIQEAKDLIGIDDGVVLKILNDCENVLNGGEDKELYLSSISKEKYKQKIESIKQCVNEKQSMTTKIQCLKCNKIWGIYKIEDKWIFKCDCGTVILFEGKLTALAKKTTYKAFVNQYK